ncbi:hypothetical protein GJ744_008226 [Endocarpon pusillum]|uniref:Uncharacterized protein n=1 Tax=Endocarpon pusillum TaxID=364733 RepID=A0A8H7ALG3_9EURO|nr:hypothetical protein GJ744_008226 [Endocarpon pusillum]
MSIVPQHTVALNFNGYHGVIYVDPGPNLNTVSWLHYAGSEPDRKQYEPQNAIQVKGKNAIKAHQGKIALVHYTTNNEETYQVRLWPNRCFICWRSLIWQHRSAYTTSRMGQQKTTQAKTTKLENYAILRSDGKPTFDAQKIIADENSPLSATYDGKILRVYYKKPKEEKLYVAFTKNKPALSAAEVWDQRVAADKF